MLISGIPSRRIRFIARKTRCSWSAGEGHYLIDSDGRSVPGWSRVALVQSVPATEDLK